MNKPILDVQNINKSFQDQHASILENISFELYESQSMAITGVSGSGKSTLLHILAGLDHPTSGKVHLCGYDLTLMTNHQLAEIRAHLTGFIFQFHHLLFEFNVYENVALSAKLAGVNPIHINEWVLEALSNVNLSPNLWYASCQQLSGGERQRVACARAVVHRPSLILADEPTGCLDDASSELMIKFILDYQENFGCGLVVVTHDLRVASRLQRRFNLVSGKIQEFDRRKI